MSWLTSLWQRPEATPAPPQSPPGDPTWEAFEALLRQREGCRLTVYRDSLGKPTVGIGHLVTPEDHLEVGQTISQAEVDALFLTDGKAAYRAAAKQMSEAGITDETFHPYLASVCFQLGSGWTKEFAGTWGHIVNGQYQLAAAGLEASAWAKQTPVRVKDFQEALRRLPSKH